MEQNECHRLRKPLTWLTIMGFSLVSLFGAPALQSHFWPGRLGVYSVNTASELRRLDLWENLSENDIEELCHYQETYHVKFPYVLKDPYWVNRLGLSSRKFKATWYVSNPFDLLPDGLKDALKARRKAFRTRKDVWEWASSNHFSPKWKTALKAALIETTPENLLRAAHGKQPYAKNGQFLEPIVIEHGEGMLEVKDGHIATDPRVISLNSEVILLARINGADQIIKVKAADIGGKIKGYHVDLPIRIHPRAQILPTPNLPADKIRNVTVEILSPAKKIVNPNRKV